MSAKKIILNIIGGVGIVIGVGLLYFSFTIVLIGGMLVAGAGSRVVGMMAAAKGMGIFLLSIFLIFLGTRFVRFK